MSAINNNITSWSNMKEDSGKDILSPSSQQIFLLTVAYPPMTGPNGQVVKAVNSFGQSVEGEQHILLQPASVIPLSKSKEASVSNLDLAEKCESYTPLMVLNAECRTSSNSDLTAETANISTDYILQEGLNDATTGQTLSADIEQLSSKLLSRSFQSTSMLSFETPTLSEFTCTEKGSLSNSDLNLSSSELGIGSQLKKHNDTCGDKGTEEKLPNELCTIGWDSDSDSGDATNIISDNAVLPRAKQTLPVDYLKFQDLPNEPGVIGVFATKEITVKTQFGPLEGVIDSSPMKEPPCPGLKFLIENSSGTLSQLVTTNEDLANWMKYVRVAKRLCEQNLSLRQIKDSLYFTTTKPISPGQELKLWYSIKYAFKRDLPLLTDSLEKWQCPKCPFICTTSRPMNSHLAKHKSDQTVSEKDPEPQKSKVKSLPIKPVNNSRLKSVKNKQTDLFFNDVSTGKDQNMKSIWCERCDVSFNTTALLNIHMLMHAANNIEASSSETGPSSAEEEESGDGGKELLFCDVCGKQFHFGSSLAAHYRSHYEESYECPICNETFDKLLSMRYHIHKHKKNGVYTCSKCSKAFPTYKQIRKHIRRGHSNRLFGCPECLKTFPSADKVKVHMLSHSNHKQFLCAYCGKQFKRKDKLCHHMRNAHYLEKEKTYRLAQNNVQESSSSPQKNVNVDYTLSSYKCHECELGFKRRGMLVNHVLSRHPQTSLEKVPDLNQPILKPAKDYHCQYCDKIYRSSSKRKAHILKYHPGADLPPGNRYFTGENNEVIAGTFTQTVGSIVADPHCCEWCSKQYVSKAKLLQHQRKMHLSLMPKSLRKSTNEPPPPPCKRTKKSLPVENSVEVTRKNDVSKAFSQDSTVIRNNIAETNESDTNLQVFSDGGIIVDGPTLKKALKIGETSSVECLLDAGLEQLLAESRPGVFFKILTQGGVTIAQPVELWDPLSLSSAQVTANHTSNQTQQSSSIDSNNFLPR